MRPEHVGVLAHRVRAHVLGEAVYVRVAAAHSLPAVRHARVRRRRQQARRCAGAYGEALRSADAAHRLDESRAAAFKHPHEATSFGRSEGYKLPPLRLPPVPQKTYKGRL